MIDLDAIVEGSLKLSPATKTVYRRTVRDWLLFAGTEPAGWTGAAAQAFYMKLRETMQPQSAEAMIWGLKYVSKRAHKLYAIPDFGDAIELGKTVVQGRTNALTMDEARRLLAACVGETGNDIRDRAIVSLLLATGMRKISLHSTSFERLRSHPRHTSMEVLLKGGKMFDVPITRGATPDIDAWVRWAVDHGATRGAFFRSVTIPRVTGKPALGDALSMPGIYKALVKRARAAGLDEFHPHTLRHTFITWCRVAGVDALDIAAITGHVTERGTINRVYTDLSAVAERALAAIEPVLAPLWA